ncbi:MAG TPA: acyl-CoA dehydrogenase family protein [Oligoflexia bacterium]|nr:acyl-CoA dehydrogenase family protein [Oligoflexia bacterium]HMP49016.1 acyl-CoA dehydrogenase family protein [Oligoflexia bacterium]
MNGFELLLTEEEIMIRDSARAFAEEKVRPLAKKIDHEHYFPKELLPELSKMGFMGVCVDSAYGGSGLSSLAYALIIEELSRVCASTSVIVSAHNSLALWPIEHFGTEQQKLRYLPDMTSGKSIGCFALSEPGTGSDAARQTCLARKDGSNWIITGVKNWITNAPVSDVCVVFTMNDVQAGHKGITAFIVDLKTTKGVSIGKHEEKLGICGSPTASIILDEVVVSDDARLGEVGEGFKIAMGTLDGGRIGIAAQALGIAEAAFGDALRYSGERKTFGQFLHQHQSIQNYLADMSTEIEAARLLTLVAARKKDKKMPYTKEAAQAKLYASEMANSVAHKALQIHGGYGYVKEFNVERYFRDAKITEIYEGTSEIQRIVIAGQLIKGL